MNLKPREVSSMEKSVICATCLVIPNALKRVSSVWKDYQTHIWVRQNGRQKVIIRGFTFVLEGLPFVQGGLTLKFNKNPLIYNVSYFNLGDLELLWGDKPTKAPRSDGTG